MTVYAKTDTKKGEQGFRLLIFKLPFNRILCTSKSEAAVTSNKKLRCRYVQTNTKHRAASLRQLSFLFSHHCGIGDFRRFIVFSRTVTGRYLRNLAKCLTPTR